jgi:hypothetical protein
VALSNKEETLKYNDNYLQLASTGKFQIIDNNAQQDRCMGGVLSVLVTTNGDL